MVLCLVLCFVLFGFVFVLVLLLFCVFAHEASEYSLDYGQVRNCLLLDSSSLTDMHAFYQFI